MHIKNTNNIELLIIRHAEARANVDGYVTGGVLDELTDKGREQAKSLGANIVHSLELDECTFVTSSMTRAIQTYRFMGLDKDFSIDDALNEHDGGSVAYMLRSEFDQKYESFWQPFDPDRKFPDGESHNDLYYRINNAVDRLIDQCQTKKIVLVAHSGTISSIMHRFFDVPMDLYSCFKADNCSVTSLNICKSDMKYPSLNYFNRNYIGFKL